MNIEKPTRPIISDTINTQEFANFTDELDTYLGTYRLSFFSAETLASNANQQYWAQSLSDLLPWLSLIISLPSLLICLIEPFYGAGGLVLGLALWVAARHYKNKPTALDYNKLLELSLIHI